MQRFSTPRLLLPDGGRSEAALLDALRGLGLPVGNAELATAENILGGLSVPSLLDPAIEPDHVVRAWGALLATRRHEDPTGLLLALAAMANVFRRHDPHLDQSLATRHWNPERTASEAVIRLFGTEFNIGRRLVPDRRRRTIGRALLVEALATSTRVTAEIHSTPSRLRFHGQRGVAYLLLARGEFSSSTEALLEAASTELAASRRLGDNSLQHFEYAIETLLRRDQKKTSVSLITEAEALLARVGLVSRRLAYNAGDIALRHGIEAMADGRPNDALPHYSQAIEAYSAGLAIESRQFDIPGDDLRAKRGYARLRAYYASSTSGNVHSAADLDGIIDDLTCGQPDPYTGATPLPEALLQRAILLRSSGDLESAIRDLSRALECSRRRPPGDVQSRVRCQFSECHLERALGEHDPSAAEAALRDLLAVDEAADPSIPLLAGAVRYIVGARGHRTTTGLIREVATKLRALMRRPHCVGATRAFAASYLAGLLFRLGDLIYEQELREVCALYTEAVDLSEEAPSPEVLALGADAKLRLAKLLLASGHDQEEPRSLLEDSIELLKTSISAVDRASDAYDQQVAHSKAGEALVRLSSLTGDVKHAEDAARHLERSKDLGNDAAELFGLLGDCYYRIGRARTDMTALQEAVRLKEAARARADASKEHSVSMRENWSVSARIHETIWRHGGSRRELASAIQCALSAHSADPAWPWPTFQLATMRDAAGPEFERTLHAASFSRDVDPRLEAALRYGTTQALEALGAELAVQQDEFSRRVLGGRTSVYVIDDPHALLSDTIVLKRNTARNAEREATDAQRFAGFLGTCGADPQFRLPRPIAVVPMQDSAAVYAMRHARGRELGAFVVDGLRHGKPVDVHLYERVVDFLAWFHAWSWREGTGIGPNRPVQLLRTVESIARAWTLAVDDPGTYETVCSLMTALVPERAVGLRKKDAHPENWLVSSRGEIVLVDLESTTLLPVFYDFCQLVDDYPFFAVTRHGMEQRKELLQTYERHLEQRIPEVSMGDLVDGDDWAVACGFTLLRAAFGIARILRATANREPTTTSSSLRSTTMRREHYVQLIDWFADEGPSAPLVACARHLAETVRILGPPVQAQ